MIDICNRLVALAKSVEPKDGYFGYFDLVDALEANPGTLSEFRAILASARPEELDGASELDEKYGWIVMGAADAMDLLPDDPRLFLSEQEAAALTGEKILEALCSACVVNDRPTVARLAKRADVNTLDHNKQLPLAYAVGNNHPECVRTLIEHGANPNVVQNWGNTAMHVCATSVSSKEIFQMLQAAGGDVSLKNDQGKTVLDLLRDLDRVDWPTA